MEAEVMMDAPVVRAVEDGDMPLLAELLEGDPTLVDAKGGHQCWTPLMAATFMGRMDIVRWLLDRGANMDLRGRDGETALLLAAVCGRQEVVELLLERGARTDLTARGSCTVLILAAAGGRVDIVRAVLRHAAHQVDVRNREGRTALWKACYGGHVEVARVLLLEGGADWTLGDRHGRRPKDVAQLKGHGDCVRLLQWFEEEVQRAYVLHRARGIREQYVTLQRYPTARVPVWLAGRVAASLPLPSVEVVAPHGSTEEAAAPRWKVCGKRGRPEEEEEAGGGPMGVRRCREEGEEEETEATVGFVLDELNHELYRELMDGLRLPA